MEVVKMENNINVKFYHMNDIEVRSTTIDKLKSDIEYAVVSNCCDEYIVYLNDKLSEIEAGNDVEINDYFVFQVDGSETPKVKKFVRVQKTIKHVSIVISVGNDSILVNANKLQYDSQSCRLVFYLNDELVTSINLDKINLKFFHSTYDTIFYTLEEKIKDDKIVLEAPEATEEFEISPRLQELLDKELLTLDELSEIEEMPEVVLCQIVSGMNDRHKNAVWYEVNLSDGSNYDFYVK
jgi:hypothetical protein